MTEVSRDPKPGDLVLFDSGSTYRIEARVVAIRDEDVVAATDEEVYTVEWGDVDGFAHRDTAPDYATDTGA